MKTSIESQPYEKYCYECDAVTMHKDGFCLECQYKHQGCLLYSVAAIVLFIFFIVSLFIF